ncbi:MAG: class I tRNA ligase family protein, partial [Sutterella sp.]|nr:class I tRNA ligase family protein [Sutterella sp.]
CSPDCTTGMVDKRADYWMPMDQYIGGIEHAVLHLLYARFWTKVMRDLGLVKYDEPFKNLFTQGMLMAESYYRLTPEGRKQWFYPDEVEVQYDEKGRPVGAICKADGQPVTLGGIEKMSKSKNNVVEPRDIINKFGADTARSFVMFAGPPDQSAAWSNSGAEGTYRFLRRIWTWAYARHEEIRQAPALDGLTLEHDAKHLRREVHAALRQADYDFSRMQYNTVVSACMKMFNVIEGFKGTSPADQAARAETASILLRTLYPIAPHISTALWGELGFAERIGELIDAPWPQWSEDAIKADELKLVVQVNGKLRGEILVPSDADQAAIEAAALANPDVQRFIAGVTVRKIIVVKNRLVNVVAK